MSALAVAGIGAASRLAGGAISAGSSKRSQARAYEYNKSLMDYQNRINLQNWQLENAYNSPSAQMQRYRAAGLNPNLVAGDIGGSVGVAGDIGSVSPSGASPSEFAYGRDFGQALAGIGDDLNNYYVNKQRVADTQAKVASTGVLNHQADAIRFANHITESTLMETITQRLNSLRLDIMRNNADAIAIESRRVDNMIGLNARGYEVGSVDPSAGGIPYGFGQYSNNKYSGEYTIQKIEEFRNNVKSDVATALYELNMHTLDNLAIGNQRGYLKMLNAKYDIEKINAEFEKAVANLSFEDILQHPGKLLNLIFKAIGDAQTFVQPYLLNYQRHQYTPEVMRDYTEERYDPVKGSQVITRLYH